METTVMESCVAVADACSVVQGKGMAHRRPLLRLKITMGGKLIGSCLCRRQDQRLIAGADDEDDDDDGETVNSPPLDDDILDRDDACSRLDDGETSLLLQKKLKKKTKKMKKKTKEMKKKKKNPGDDQILPKQPGEIADNAAAARTMYRLKIIHDGKVYVVGSRPEHSSSNQEDQERSTNKSKEDGTGDCHRQKRKHSVDDHEEQPWMKKLKPDGVACGCGTDDESMGKQ